MNNQITLLFDSSFVHNDSKVTIRLIINPSSTTTTINSQMNSSNSLINKNESMQGLNKTPKPNQLSTNSSSLIQTPILSVASMFSSNKPEQVKTKSDESHVQSTASTASLNTATTTITAAQNHSQQQQQNIVYDDINIFMWSVCKICNKTTKKIVMSPQTWSYSLAKFLELTFYAKNYCQFSDNQEAPCTHSLFQDHYQYFRFKNTITVFSLSKINIQTLNLPVVPLKLNSTFTRSRSEYIEEIKDLIDKAVVLFSTLVERISSLKSKLIFRLKLNLKHEITICVLLIRFELARKANSEIGPIRSQDKHGSIANVKT